MAFNRLVDRRIDAANPRTGGRALPAGLVSAGGRAAVRRRSAAALLVLAAWQLNPLALGALPAGAVHPLSLLLHQAVHLGWRIWCSACRWPARPSAPGSPCAADVDATPLMLAGVVLLWVAGFDILYAPAGHRVRPADGVVLDPGPLRRGGRAVDLGRSSTR